MHDILSLFVMLETFYSKYLHIPHLVCNMYMLPKHYEGDHDKDHPNKRRQ